MLKYFFFSIPLFNKKLNGGQQFKRLIIEFQKLIDEIHLPLSIIIPFLVYLDNSKVDEDEINNIINQQELRSRPNYIWAVNIYMIIFTNILRYAKFLNKNVNNFFIH